jgi:hypothetical protein
MKLAGEKGKKSKDKLNTSQSNILGGKASKTVEIGVIPLYDEKHNQRSNEGSSDNNL